MNVSAWAIRSPVPSLLLFVILTFMGLMGFRSLMIQSFPDIELPVITVVASLEGAAPAQLETEVARKIEEQVSSLSGLKHITTTVSDGSATIAAEFEIEKDIETALSEVRNAVDSIKADLPANMNDPIVSKVTTSGNPIVTFTVASNNLDEEQLSWFVDNEVSKALLATPGVGRVSRIGGVDQRCRLT